MKIDYFSQINNSVSTTTKNNNKKNEVEISDNNKNILKLREIPKYQASEHIQKSAKRPKNNRSSSSVKKSQSRQGDIIKDENKINEYMNINNQTIIEKVNISM